MFLASSHSAQFDLYLYGAFEPRRLALAHFARLSRRGNRLAPVRIFLAGAVFFRAPEMTRIKTFEPVTKVLSMFFR